MDIAGGLLAILLLILGSCVGAIPGVGFSIAEPSPVSVGAASSLAPAASPVIAGSPVTSDSPIPGPSVADAAYLQLLATIPEPIRSSCEQYTGYSESFPAEPGELAEADCTLSAGVDGEYVSYKLFDSAASMQAFYDIQLQGMTGMGGVSGPGCFQGPGADGWAEGQRFCFQVLTDDANVRWTHDALATVTVAIEDDGDWARLQTLWESAGPVAP